MPNTTAQRLTSSRALDLAIVVAGVVALVFSFLSYYTVSVVYLDDSTTAWHGFFGWFGTVLAVAGAAVVASALFAPRWKLPLPAHLVAFVLFSLGAASTFAALFVNGYDTDHGVPGAQVDTGHGYGYWISLLVIVAGTALTAVRVRQAGWPPVSSRRADGTLGCEPSGAGTPGEGATR